MVDTRNFTIEQFLNWLADQDLENINNHIDHNEAVEENLNEDGVANLEQEDDEDVEGEDEGIEQDCVGESATVSKRLGVRDHAGAVYCTMMSFIKVPTEVKDYLLCQLCYWRYMDRCHPLTTHRQASFHKSTNIRGIPRLYCGVCDCNLFTITNVSTCTQCNEKNNT